MAINNELMISASIEEHEELLLDVENLVPRADCCIYKVPKTLRKMNEEAYTPQVVSIGPLHYGCNQAMEKQKTLFAGEFCKRIGAETWQVLKTFIGKNVQRIRNCYAEMPKMEDSKFTKMILYDAVFVIEYIRMEVTFSEKLRHETLKRYPKVGSDILMKSLQPVKFSIWSDLLLLENQLPYFVLEGVYSAAFPQNRQVYPPFFPLAFGFVCPDVPDKGPHEVEVQHFIDMRRYFVTITHHDKKQELRGAERDLPSVSKLQEAGVTFTNFKEAKCFIEMKVQKKKMLRIPYLNFPELQIPQIRIYNDTEIVIRNLMALEQCHYPDETHICNYIYLMDHIIDTEEDVSLLIEAGIISNRVGDNAKIAKMFNQLVSFITFSASPYQDVVPQLRKNYKNPWNHAKATLKRVYFSNPWKGTGTVAAVVLLLLTLIQTICAIKKP